VKQRIGIALSGGGHRAAMWAAGVLIYFADVGHNREVRTISSVSGGSITNGVIAHELDYAQADATHVRERLEPLIRHVANTGLFFWGPATNTYVTAVLGTLVLGALTVAIDTVYCFAFGIDAAAAVVLLSGALVLTLGMVLFTLRSRVVDRALARTHFSRDRRPTRLTEVDRSIDHVFCATELQSGLHVYFAPTFVRSYRFGTGSPADLKLSTVVQASACLPGAFAARRLPTAPHKLVRNAKITEPAKASHMLLTDGGVYDNMADQWLNGVKQRTLNGRGRTDHPEFADQVVVNSSASKPWAAMKSAALPVYSEITTLLRVKDVQYKVSTSHRRENLVDRWDSASRRSLGPRGALVQINQSPYVVIDKYKNSLGWPDRAERAANAQKWLEANVNDTAENRKTWAQAAEQSTQVPTVLRKLGPDATANLLRHAYVLAACNLHVILGYELPATVPSIDEFIHLTQRP
jgi:predicted acylesterase/phospholipase RssA